MNPLFITGDPEWEDYTVEVQVRPLSLDDMAGVVFRYHTNRHYYLFALTDGKTARLAVRLPHRKNVPRGGMARARQRTLSVRHDALLPLDASKTKDRPSGPPSTES